ncbi:MAG: hypothetical protein M3Q58_01235 [Bacteroidota bacterium]|nr:hypothetical protein [Bacteroidota bacterium]
METKKILHAITTTFCVIAFSSFLSCQTGQADRVETDPESSEKIDQATVDELDQRIGEINEDISSIERQLIEQEKFNDEDVVNKWLDIEAKRQVLNQTIASYNSAITEGQEERANSLMSEINNQLKEIETEIENLEDQADINEGGLFD